jgi:hypothetical protein
MTAKFWFELLHALASLVTAASGVTALWLFYYFRRRMPKLQLEISALHESSDHETRMYITVTVTNLDYVMVQGDYCRVLIRVCERATGLRSVSIAGHAIPVADGAPDVSRGEDRWSIPFEDDDRIWVLDKGESNTFSFSATIPTKDVVACHIQAEYHSRELTGQWPSAPPFGWRRDAFYELRAPSVKSE